MASLKKSAMRVLDAQAARLARRANWAGPYVSLVARPPRTAPPIRRVDRAMAHVILPSLLYREQRYKLPEAAPIQTAAVR